MILGGPALYLLGESLFGWRMTGATSAKRVAVAALLILLVPLAGRSASCCSASSSPRCCSRSWSGSSRRSASPLRNSRPVFLGRGGCCGAADAVLASWT